MPQISERTKKEQLTARSLFDYIPNTSPGGRTPS
jgi:hypothetical protein